MMAKRTTIRLWVDVEHESMKDAYTDVNDIICQIDDGLYNIDCTMAWAFETEEKDA
jgi:hypothetical protein